MKLIKTIYDYRYGAKEIVSFLKNRLSKVFWGHNTAKDTEAYYQINREASDAIDEMFKILNAEFRVPREMVNHLGGTRLSHMVNSKLAYLIADELMKTEKLIVILREDINGDFIYSVSVPFLTRPIDEDENDHVTRDIKPLGQCPACDVYHNKHLPSVGVSETIHFQKNIIDTHAAYSESTNKYTIVLSGVYTVVKHFEVGEVIENPILVTNKKL